MFWKQAFAVVLLGVITAAAQHTNSADHKPSKESSIAKAGKGGEQCHEKPLVERCFAKRLIHGLKSENREIRINSTDGRAGRG